MITMIISLLWDYGWLKKKSCFSSRKESGFLLVKKYCNYNIQINRDFCDFQKAVLKEQIKGKKEREVAQSCTTLCDPMDRSPPGSYVQGILKASVLEWVAISLSRGTSQPGIEPESPALADRFFTTEPPGNPSTCVFFIHQRETLHCC